MQYAPVVPGSLAMRNSQRALIPLLSVAFIVFTMQPTDAQNSNSVPDQGRLVGVLGNPHNISIDGPPEKISKRGTCMDTSLQLTVARLRFRCVYGTTDGVCLLADDKVRSRRLCGNFSH